MHVLNKKKCCTTTAPGWWYEWNKNMLETFGPSKCGENLVYVHEFWIKICRNVALHQLTDLLNNVLAFLRNAINFW